MTQRITVTDTNDIEKVFDIEFINANMVHIYQVTGLDSPEVRVLMITQPYHTNGDGTNRPWNDEDDAVAWFNARSGEIG
tara:strand:- start:1508 stop:1744 length:237 start_codon:yes stop_codon:yes gene_type:complete